MEDASRLLGGGLKYVWDVLAIQLRNLEALRLAQKKMIERHRRPAPHQIEMLEATLRRAFGGSKAPPTPPSDVRAALPSQIARSRPRSWKVRRTRTSCPSWPPAAAVKSANILQSRMMAALDEFRAALEQTMPARHAPAQAAPPALTVQPALSRERPAGGGRQRYAAGGSRGGVLEAAAWFGGAARPPIRSDVRRRSGQVRCPGSAPARSWPTSCISRIRRAVGAGIVPAEYGCAVDRYGDGVSPWRASPSGLACRCRPC